MSSKTTHVTLPCLGTLVLAAALAAGCAKSPASSAPATAAASAMASGPAGTAAVRPAAGHSFAALPDRGELLDYAGNDPAHDVIHDGAYTWHRAGLSERHAMNAMADGHLRLTTPAGKSLDISYDRHVEHDSGDWTWIGHIAGHPEQQTVLTFGAHAAFGSIGQPDGPPLRLTVRNGSSWVVETDPGKIALIDNAATRPRKPDYRIPPKRPAAGDVRAAGAPPTAATVAAATATTSTTVDVLIGYTAAFAADNGGGSGAMTRLNFMVDVANTAYGNSAISAKVRLVHAMQVSYPDATSNDNALERLTGFDTSSNTQTTPDPAFNALRAAREQYGADVVSLVRKYSDPENGGCGIAWLIGGSQSGVSTSDSFFGYSVVSDGTDVGTDGKSYYCLDETLAHEMGHNMGAAHDVETAKGDDGTLDANDYGAYPYSFGYKTTSTTGNFYTIMAYGDSGQHIYRIFSDPRSTFCGGRACGTTQADNARTLTQTIPIVATFRASTVLSGNRLANDFNGDGKSDVLWRHTGSGNNVIWRSASSAAPKAVAPVTDQAWSVSGTGDFDADGYSDILWRNRNTGANVVWRSGDSGATKAVAAVPSQDWIVAGVADFDGDGCADILWRNVSTGANVIWGAASSAIVERVAAATPPWEVAGVGDFNGDGQADILWRNRNSGANAIWRSGNWEASQAVASVPNLRWSVAGVGDFDGDGLADILWRHTTGSNVIWRSANASMTQSVASATGGWAVASTGDYDGDGKFDLLWRNTTSGANAIWRSAASTTPLAVTRVPDLEWIVADGP